jgi:predicted transposase YbfD/YdcC
VLRHKTREKGHGREETREYYVCAVRDGKTTCQRRYYILSKKLTAKEFAAAVRGHWSIENQLHWQLDLSFGEDQSRLRRGHADQNFSSLRRAALVLLKNNRGLQCGVKNKRLAAGWDEDYLLEVLLGK